MYIPKHYRNKSKFNLKLIMGLGMSFDDAADFLGYTEEDKESLRENLEDHFKKQSILSKYTDEQLENHDDVINVVVECENG